MTERNKKSQVAKFLDKYMKKLIKISKMMETLGATKSEVYQRMADISIEKKEYAKAADYMTKALDVLREDFKAAEQREAERRQAEKEAVEASRNNTQAIKEWIAAIREGREAIKKPK